MEIHQTRGGAGTEVGLQHLPAGQLQTSPANLPLPRRRRRNRKRRRRKVQFPSLSFVPSSCSSLGLPGLDRGSSHCPRAPSRSLLPCSPSAPTPLQANPPLQPHSIFFQDGRCPLSWLCTGACVPVTCSATGQGFALQVLLVFLREDQAGPSHPSKSGVPLQPQVG